jgi:hypothetical protein
MISKIKFLKSILLTLTLSLLLAGCGEKENDPDVTAAAPTLTLSSASASASPGSSVQTTVSINAPAGLKKLTINKNGSNLQEQAFSFEKTANYTFTYTLESGLANGSDVNFSFEAVDSLDQKSEQKVFTITVTEIPAREVVEVTADISANVTFTANKIWRLNNMIKVNDGVVLTIEPGTTVMGASDPKGTLLVLRGGKIIADGTASSPIIFTSDKAPGSRTPGDWGGIVICGKAPNNQGNSVTLEGNYGATYGGTVANDNSGILRFVRIEFAGIEFQDNQEINSLTLASVGSGTIIENVQCSFGLDDSFEFFGGTVNAKNLISYMTEDDDFDFDFGHTGFIQFALAIRNGAIADKFYSNGMEFDNVFSGSSAAPITQTVLSNITIIGAKYSSDNTVDARLQNAAHIRTNSMPSIYNSFITGFPVGIFIDDTKPGSSLHALNNELQIRNVILAGVENWGNNNWGGSAGNLNAPLKQVNAPGFDINNWFNTLTSGNTILTKWQDAGIDQSIYTSTTPKLTLNAGAMLLTAAKWNNTPKASGTFFEQVAFAGAFGTTDWSAGWSNFDPQSVEHQ